MDALINYFNDLIQPVLLAGGLSGGTMGTIHYLLRPLHLSRPVCYTIGSVCCLVALAGALSTRQVWLPVEVMILSLGIWVITGSVVVLTYLIDGLNARQRRQARRREANREGKGAKDGENIWQAD